MKLHDAEKVMLKLNRVFASVPIPDRVFIIRYYEHALFQAADDLEKEEGEKMNGVKCRNCGKGRIKKGYGDWCPKCRKAWVEKQSEKQYARN